MAKEYFIQGSIKHPGRTKHYLMRVYGNRAFTMNGTIRPEYLEKAIDRAKANRDINLEKALVEAKTLKRFARKKAMA